MIVDKNFREALFLAENTLCWRQSLSQNSWIASVKKENKKLFKKFIITKTHLISLAYLDFPNFKSFMSGKIVQKYSVSIFAGSTTGDIRHKGESFDVRLNGSVGTSFNRALKLIIYLCKCTWCTRINQSQFLLKRNLSNST